MSAGAGFMRAAARGLRFGLCAMLCLAVLSCGDGGGDGGNITQLNGGNSSSSSSSNTTAQPGELTTNGNVVNVIVDAGLSPSTSPVVNRLYTTVTICPPGSTTNCVTIDHIQVDTGSSGLRIISSALGSVRLPLQTTSEGESLMECAQFVAGYSWGPVATADVHISGETASSAPVQVIDGLSIVVPSDCASIGPALDTVAEFGANGILGVGVFTADCGTRCASSQDNGIYYGCSSDTQCNGTTVANDAQVANPVSRFATDNNGVIITLPTVAAAGAPTVGGTMIFGIDTEGNNVSGSQTILTLDPYGDFTTAFDGQTLSQSFLDTGSSALSFPDSSLPMCTGMEAGLYCPSSTQVFTATLTGQNGGLSSNVSFSVANAQTLIQGGKNLAAFMNLAAAFPTTIDPGASATGSFDWGLPFFYGKTVYTALDGLSTSVGNGPYIAF